MVEFNDLSINHPSFRCQPASHATTVDRSNEADSEIDMTLVSDTIERSLVL
jgi:hypothetical protein